MKFAIGDKVVVSRYLEENEVEDEFRVIYDDFVGTVGVIIDKEDAPEGDVFKLDTTDDCLWHESELVPFGAGAEYFNELFGGLARIKDDFKIGDEVIIAKSIFDSHEYTKFVGTTGMIINRIGSDGIVLSNSPEVYWEPGELMPAKGPWTFEYDRAEELL